MHQFFIEKFDFDYSANIKWTKVFEGNEDILPAHGLKLMSHIINAHHIWITRLQGKQPESGTWDVFDVDFLAKLHMENLRATNDFLEKTPDLIEIVKMDLGGKTSEFSIFDVLYHILNHSNYHRAQISMLLKMNQIETVETNFISWARKV